MFLKTVTKYDQNLFLVKIKHHLNKLIFTKKFRLFENIIKKGSQKAVFQIMFDCF